MDRRNKCVYMYVYKDSPQKILPVRNVVANGAMAINPLTRWCSFQSGNLIRADSAQKKAPVRVNSTLFRGSLGESTVVFARRYACV